MSSNGGGDSQHALVQHQPYPHAQSPRLSDDQNASSPSTGAQGNIEEVYTQEVTQEVIREGNGEATQEPTEEGTQEVTHESPQVAVTASSPGYIHESTPESIRESIDITLGRTLDRAQESTQVLLSAPSETPQEEFQIADPDAETTKQKYFSGRSVSLRFFTVCVSLVLILNITLIVYTSRQGQRYGSSWTIYEGSCSSVKKLDTGLHAVINVLGIIILAAVGAFLTLLSSPTREDLNSVHEKGKWLEIGIPSFRNFSYMNWTRKVLLMILFLASWPLHILYNSVIFTQISTRWFTWMVVTTEFLANENFNAENTTYLPTSCFSSKSEAFPPVLSKILSMHAQASNYTRLEPVECLKTYSDLYPTTYSDILMVTSNTNSTNNLLAWDTNLNFDTSRWLCSGPKYCGNYDWDFSVSPCDFRQLEKNPSSWISMGHPIEYCLAQPENSNCQLLLEPSLTITIIVTNFLIMVVMLVCLTCCWHELKQTLSCFGDVVASYLESEEEVTKGMCLADKQSIDHFWEHRGTLVELDSRKRSWQSVMSLRRHRLLLALFVIGLLAVMICVAYTLWIVQSDRHLSISISGLWRLGFGSNTQTSGLLVNLDGSPASLSVTSNIPQLFLAIVTLFTNAAFVEMTQADEYVRFLTKRATLRVSNPSGEQRGTYLLGMPYRYAGPMLAITSAVHWSISQSIVLVYIDSTSTNPATPYVFTTSDLSFSPLAIVVSLVLAGVLVVTTIAFGFKRLPSKIPLASSCSLALSAAVHPGGTAAPFQEFLKVKWGVVEPGHCSFSTSNLITEPEEEIKYK